MPTVAALLTATQDQLAQLDAQTATAQAQIETRLAQLAQAEVRRALLKTRLEALQALALEEP